MTEVDLGTFSSITVYIVDAGLGRMNEFAFIVFRQEKASREQKEEERKGLLTRRNKQITSM